MKQCFQGDVHTRLTSLSEQEKSFFLPGAQSLGRPAASVECEKQQRLKVYSTLHEKILAMSVNALLMVAFVRISVRSLADLDSQKRSEG